LRCLAAPGVAGQGVAQHCEALPGNYKLNPVRRDLDGFTAELTARRIAGINNGSIQK